MTEQEKLHHAKHYIDSLANGLNPLDGTPIPEQDIVNNVKISRCLFFVSDVLRKQLDGHEPKKVSEKDKKLFYITEEEKLQYVPSKTPIPASGISYKVNEILDEKKMRKVSYRTITTWLVKVGLMEEEDISDGELMYSGDAVENCRYILKNYCKEHDGEFIAVHEVVSRVKAVE